MSLVDVFFAAVTFGAWVVGGTLLLTAAWIVYRATTWTCRLARAAWQWRHDTRPPLPQRTPEDVLADAANHRARREAEQEADDLDTCRYIWPNPPTWRTAKAQHRHDTAKHRKENEQ